ncbi:glycosyltransferase family 4 protein [Thauera aminoaromatica]|uniref:Glycosyl transferase group 1 n=1 Tax=Thauera aminoaromatica TaxID=164330 RepID=C4KD78_THASP|nr:glycosyltransferase family 4 protein [Thauera aminoaromatica]ACR02489.1 glycosyl transferase group 1 [Thauera aminoaromatica]
MRIAFLCKRRYMGKDVILDRYARLYEIPRQLAHLDNEVGAFCLDYHAADTDGCWEHEAAPGRLRWHSLSVGRTRLPRLAAYPWHLLRQLRAFKPDILVGASDIPHVVLARWLARRLQVPYAIDLYDNFEGFGQARIPGFVPALRRAVRDATVVTTTSEPLRQKVLADGARGTVIAMPSSVDLAVFHPGDKAQARQALSLPQDGKLVGTAGGLYREKGIEPLYAAWPALAASRPDVHLVLAGPLENGFAPPQGERVHYLGHLAHGQIANLFRALDVGIISILDTPFGRYCFPQKAYEMLACKLPVVATAIGQMREVCASTPQALFAPGDSTALTRAVLWQLQSGSTPAVPIADWKTLIGSIEPVLKRQSGAAAGG